MTRRLIVRTVLLSLGALVWLAGGCAAPAAAPGTAAAPTSLPATATPPPTPTVPPPTPTPIPFEGLAEWDVVVIGDCRLGGVAEPYARLVEQDLGVKVTVHDNTTAYDADTILKGLRGDSGGAFARRNWPQLIGTDAEVVVLWANPAESVAPELAEDLEICRSADFKTAFRQPQNCTADAFATFRADLDAIYAEIAKLRQGRPLILLATDGYNALVGAQGEQGIDGACRVCWEVMSSVARQAAEQHGVPFVGACETFNGPRYDEDPRAKGLVREGMECPSDAGAQLYAERLHQSGYAYWDVPD